MDILPIQASSVPCERVFSSATLTITPRRNRLGNDIVEATQMLKYSAKDDPTAEELNFTGEFSEEAVLKEMEEHDKVRNFESMDFPGYREYLQERTAQLYP